ncbi:hypothetical protein E2C01_089476 [Portunus trituberculatus]|uniref:Uncharacterized protein n=1 Tax=Portunus trituberculatus TaxID=210409 RepID=A0A5B7JDN1_PORTR|nr:hypothetical protein [Portunus trituberculatus]
MLLLTCRVVLLQLLCVLAAATSQGERTWTLEATLLHDDPSHPPEPTLKESVHENLETLATLELTLHDLHLDESVVSSPGSPGRLDSVTISAKKLAAIMGLTFAYLF